MNPTVFQYPKSKHTRTLSPTLFRKYRTYKKYLQIEFYRTCVYCRQPDSSAPNLNFGVDHYKPKSVPRFAGLVCDYQNLYYCCGNCNSRKNNAWPVDEKNGPYVVNPCDHVMSQHLRFDATSGTVTARSKYGEYTDELLQLNDGTLIEFRKSTLAILKMSMKELTLLQDQINQLNRLLRQHQISKHDFEEACKEINLEIATAEAIIQSYSGTKKLSAIPGKRFGVTLSK